MTMLIIGLAATLGGCYELDFGAGAQSPFQCSVDGECPPGYRCAPAGLVVSLCVAADAPTPPAVLGAIEGGSPSMQPLWTAEGFRVLWPQSQAERAPDEPIPPAIVSTALDADGVGDSNIVKALPLDTRFSFSALYHPKSRRIVVATAENSEGAKSRATVFSRADEKPMNHHLQTRPPALPGFGFSKPSLSLLGEDNVAVALSFTMPPDSIVDNILCDELSIASRTKPTDCAPSQAQTDGGYAAEVLLAASDEQIVHVWRDLTMHLAARVSGEARPRVDLPFQSMAAARFFEDRLALLASTRPTSDQRSWRLLLSKSRFEQYETSDTDAVEWSIDTPIDHTPGLAHDATVAVVCAYDVDGAFRLHFLDPTDLSPSRAAFEVPRISNAEVKQCRIALGPSKGIAVVWYEADGFGGRAYTLLVSP